MIDIAVEHAELNYAGGRGAWRLSCRVTQDGTTFNEIQIIPVDTIEWRVAQFNVDPVTAAEMIVLEPYAPDTFPDQELAASRSEARQLKLAATQEALGGGSITWPTGKPAWSASLLETHPEEVLVDSGDGDALQTMIEFSPVDEEAVAIKREALDIHRARRRRRTAQRQAGAQMATAATKTPAMTRRTPGAARVHRDPSTLLERAAPDELRRRLLPPPRDEEAATAAVSEMQPSELAERVLGKRIKFLREEAEKGDA